MTLSFCLCLFGSSGNHRFKTLSAKSKCSVLRTLGFDEWYRDTSLFELLDLRSRFYLFVLSLGWLTW